MLKFNLRLVSSAEWARRVLQGSPMSFCSARSASASLRVSQVIDGGGVDCALEEASARHEELPTAWPEQHRGRDLQEGRWREVSFPS